MTICPQCDREFPEELIERMIAGSEHFMTCPLCALRIMNELHGIPEGTPFRGEQAQHNSEKPLKSILTDEVNDETGMEIYISSG